LPVYNTSICLMALKDADRMDFKDVIQKAEDYLLNSQLDESYGLTKDSLNYGGIGYGNNTNSDLSSFQWTIESLQEKLSIQPEKNLTHKEKERAERKKLFYDKALVFLSNCQNLQTVNRQSYASNDGGFMYAPKTSKVNPKEENPISYGSMTYAGLKSMIYANVQKNDPRIIAAYHWINKHYSVFENPGLGDAGLFYYYHTMAKSLSVYGEPSLIDQEGKKHNWREELANQLIKNQNEEGWWINSNSKWRENNRILVTCYTILALESLLK
jgi:squalene-hopene/tetraprenyl-beta-curcumene cyclase